MWRVIGGHTKVPILNFPYCNHVIDLIEFVCVTSCLQLFLFCVAAAVFVLTQPTQHH